MCQVLFLGFQRPFRPKNSKQDVMPSCFHLNLFGFDHGVPVPVPSLARGLIEGLTGSEAMGVWLGSGTTVMTAVATGAMLAVTVGTAVAMGFTLARQVQPPSSAMMVSTVPRKIRILFRSKGHTSFFQVMPLVLPLGNRDMQTRFCQFFGLHQNELDPSAILNELHLLRLQAVLPQQREQIH